MSLSQTRIGGDRSPTRPPSTPVLRTASGGTRRRRTQVERFVPGEDSDSGSSIDLALEEEDDEQEYDIDDVSSLSFVTRDSFDERPESSYDEQSRYSSSLMTLRTDVDEAWSSDETSSPEEDGHPYFKGNPDGEHSLGSGDRIDKQSVDRFFVYGRAGSNDNDCEESGNKTAKKRKSSPKPTPPSKKPRKETLNIHTDQQEGDLQVENTDDRSAQREESLKRLYQYVFPVGSEEALAEFQAVDEEDMEIAKTGGKDAAKMAAKKIIKVRYPISLAHTFYIKATINECGEAITTGTPGYNGQVVSEAAVSIRRRHFKDLSKHIEELQEQNDNGSIAELATCRDNLMQLCEEIGGMHYDRCQIDPDTHFVISGPAEYLGLHKYQAALLHREFEEFRRKNDATLSEGRFGDFEKLKQDLEPDPQLVGRPRLYRPKTEVGKRILDIISRSLQEWENDPARSQR